MIRSTFFGVLFILLYCTIDGHSAHVSHTTLQKIPGLSGAVPQEISFIINDFNNAKKQLIKAKSLHHNIILHGPHGSGKTTIAYKIAELTDSVLIVLKGSSIIDTFQNSGACNIKKVFDEINARLSRDSRSIVLLIDEVDKLAPTAGASDSNKTAENAITELWTALTDNDHHPRLLKVFTLNKLKNLPEGFTGRVMGLRTIYIPNPNEDQRADVLQDYIIKYDLPELDDNTIKTFINILELHHKTCKDKLQKELTILTESLKLLDKNVRYYNPMSQNEQDKQRIMALIQHVENHRGNLLAAIGRENVVSKESGAARTAYEVVYEYCTMIAHYLGKITLYLSKPLSMLTEVQLKQLAPETAGFSNRALIELGTNIQEHAKKYNNGIISDAIIMENLKESKAKIARDQQKEAEQQRKEEIEGLTKEYTLIDVARRANSMEHYAPTDSVQNSVSVAVGLSGASVSVSTSESNQSKENVQYPSVSHIAQGTGKKEECLNSKFLKIVKQLNALKADTSITWEAILDKLSTDDFHMPIMHLLNHTYEGREISRRMSEVFKLAQEEYAYSPKVRLMSMLKHLKRERIYVDKAIISLLLKDNVIQHEINVFLQDCQQDNQLHILMKPLIEVEFQNNTDTLLKRFISFIVRLFLQKTTNVRVKVGKTLLDYAFSLTRFNVYIDVKEK